MGERSLIYHHTVNLEADNYPPTILIGYMKGPNPRILDVGCACGDVGIAIQEHFQNQAEIVGLEVDAGSANEASRTGAYADVICWDVESLTPELIAKLEDSFDYVVCGDVLEHLRNPLGALQTLKRFLKHDGRLLASIPNVAHASIKAGLLVNNFTYTPIGLLDKTHLHLFTYKSIASMMAEASIAIEKCAFTMIHRTGWQPENPYEELPAFIQRYFLEDFHSYVCQYVVACSASDDDVNALNLRNLDSLALSEANAPQYIIEYRDAVLQKLPRDDRDAHLTALSDERERLFHDRVAISAERDRIRAQLDSVSSERDAIVAELDGLKSSVMALADERERLFKDRAAIIDERNRIRANLDLATSERDAIAAERDELINRMAATICKDSGQANTSNVC